MSLICDHGPVRGQSLVCKVVDQTTEQHAVEAEGPVPAQVLNG